MANKNKRADRNRSHGKSKRSNMQRRTQRDERLQWLSTLRKMIADLDEMSISIMVDQGILPPFYGGELLEEEGLSEVLPIWGEARSTASGQKPSDVFLLALRTIPDIELDKSLLEARKQLDLPNDMSLKTILTLLAEGTGNPPEMDDEFLDLKITLILPEQQLRLLPGQTRDEIAEVVSEGGVYAVIVHLPVIDNPEEDEEWDYDWDNLDAYWFEVLTANSLAELRVVIWKYRLDLAVRMENEELLRDGDVDDINDALPDVANLAGMFDGPVLNALRLYGTTSPVRSKQAELDVIRTEDEQLVVKLPLKQSNEPVEILAQWREELSNVAQFVPNPVVHQVDTTAEGMRTIWAEVRAHPYFGWRIHQATFRPRRDRTISLSLVPSSQQQMDWIIADSLPQLYERMTLRSLWQLLSVLGYLPYFDLEADEDESEDDSDQTEHED